MYYYLVCMHGLAKVTMVAMISLFAADLLCGLAPLETRAK